MLVGYPTIEELRREGKLPECKSDSKTDGQSCYFCDSKFNFCKIIIINHLLVGLPPIEELRKGKKRAKKGADGDSVAPPKKKLDSVVKIEKEEGKN